MPLQRRLPKRGFKKRNQIVYQVVNVQDLERVTTGDVIDATALAASGLVKDPKKPVKLLGGGEVKNSYSLKVTSASRTAVEKIQAAGGSVEVAVPLREPKPKPGPEKKAGAEKRKDSKEAKGVKSGGKKKATGESAPEAKAKPKKAPEAKKAAEAEPEKAEKAKETKPVKKAEPTGETPKKASKKDKTPEEKKGSEGDSEEEQ